MAGSRVWQVRGGRDGKFRQLFHDRECIGIGYGCKENLAPNGTVLDTKALKNLIGQDHSAQVVGFFRIFTRDMSIGDTVIVPFKRHISIGKINGDYQFSDEDPYHFRKVVWTDLKDTPRTEFPEEIVEFIDRYRRKTVAEIKPEEPAHDLIIKMAENGHSLEGNVKADNTPMDIEAISTDEIEKYVIDKFPRGEMERLVKALLEAQEYRVYQTPTGPDKGIDLVAAPGPHGFGTPRICVQVKAGLKKEGSPTLQRLLGAMQTADTEHGLLVSWGGFSSEVTGSPYVQSLKVALWDRAALIDQVLEHYDKLDSDIKAELPLKRIWIVIPEVEE